MLRTFIELYRTFIEPDQQNDPLPNSTQPLTLPDDVLGEIIGHFLADKTVRLKHLEKTDEKLLNLYRPKDTTRLKMEARLEMIDKRFQTRSKIKDKAAAATAAACTIYRIKEKINELKNIIESASRFVILYNDYEKWTWNGD